MHIDAFGDYDFDEHSLQYQHRQPWMHQDSGSGSEASTEVLRYRRPNTEHRAEVSAQVSSDVSASLMRRLLGSPPAARTERVGGGSVHDTQESARGA